MMAIMFVVCVVVRAQASPRRTEPWARFLKSSLSLSWCAKPAFTGHIRFASVLCVIGKAFDMVAYCHVHMSDNPVQHSIWLALLPTH